MIPPGLGWIVVRMGDDGSGAGGRGRGPCPGRRRRWRRGPRGRRRAPGRDRRRRRDRAAFRQGQRPRGLADRANQLWTYVDKPRSWDAWDVDETYERDGEELGGVEKIEVVASGPVLGAVRVERTFRESRIVQTYQLWAGFRRLDIETEIDWHERQVLLKARFPVTVRTHEATYETMYGAVRARRIATRLGRRRSSRARRTVSSTCRSRATAWRS